MSELNEKNKLELGSEQIVTFHINNEQLGINIELVQEIIKPPKIHSIPHAPDCVKGMTYLRGNVLPVIDLRIRLGVESIDFTPTTRVLIMNIKGTLCGLIVDAVSEVVDLSSCELEESPENIFGIEGSLLSYVAKLKDSDSVILLLSTEKILSYIDLSHALEGHISADHEKREKKDTHQDDYEQFVAFKVGAEECALSILGVKEIIRFSDVTPIHQAAEYILGLMYLREKLIPVIDLRVLLGQKSLDDELKEEFEGRLACLNEDAEDYEKKRIVLDQEFSEDKALKQYMRRIIVISVNNIHVGVLVDSVSQVLNINNNLIEGPPPIITGKRLNGLNGVAKLDKGERIIVLLEVKNLLDNEDFLTIENSTEELSLVEEEVVQAQVDEEMQMVCFKVGEEEYSFDIQSVQEIIRQVDITQVPHTKSYMKGIINLRGSVSPVVSMRERFGICDERDGEQSRIIIIKDEGQSIGLIVDSVTGVVRLSTSLLEDSSKSVSLTKDKFVKSMAKLQEGKRLIGLLDSNKILYDDELKEIISDDNQLVG